MNTKDQIKQSGLKYTKQRETILQYLKDAKLPLTIKQIQSKLDQEGIAIDLSTIYRILDIFEEKNLIQKNVHLEASDTTYDYAHQNHRHFLLCVRCNKMTILQGCPIHDYEQQIEATTHYKIIRHQLELYGLCPECQESTKKHIA